MKLSEEAKLAYSWHNFEQLDVTDSNLLAKIRIGENELFKLGLIIWEGYNLHLSTPDEIVKRINDNGRNSA